MIHVTEGSCCELLLVNAERCTQRSLGEISDPPEVFERLLDWVALCCRRDGPVAAVVADVVLNVWLQERRNWQADKTIRQGVGAKITVDERCVPYRKLG